MKKQSYKIQASYLIPAYNLPTGMDSYYLTTLHGQATTGRNAIEVDVWVVNAQKGVEKESMIEALKREAKLADCELEVSVKEDSKNNLKEKSVKTRKLEHAKTIFNNLIEQSSQPVFCKEPDAQVEDAVKRNVLVSSNINSVQPNIQKALYLAGLGWYQEY
jgi:hypothetical protein